MDKVINIVRKMIVLETRLKIEVMFITRDFESFDETIMKSFDIFVNLRRLMDITIFKRMLKLLCFGGECSAEIQPISSSMNKQTARLIAAS